jgi:hypothetical protein
MGYADEVRILIGPNGDNRIVPKIARRVKTGLYIYARKMCLSEADSELFSEFASSGHVSSLMSYVTNKQFRTTSIEEFTEKELKLIFSTLVALKGK